MVLDQARHQGGAELRMTAARVIQRKSRYVELAPDHGAPLFLRLEQGFAGIDDNLEVDVGVGDFLGDDLDHFVADIAFSAGPLVRRLEGCGLGDAEG